MNNFLQRTRTAFVIVITFLVFLLLPPLFFASFFLILLCCVLYFEWSVICVKQPLFYFLTPIYPMLPFFLLMHLALIKQGKIIITFLFLFTSFFDTFCYVIGNFLGKTPLLPSISPKKTVEGFFGGVIAVFVAALVYVQLANVHSGVLFLMVIMLMTFVAALGDLFESWIKRQSSVKDSGDLLPGHGGILDRVDSLLFVVMYFYFVKDTFLSHIHP